MENTICQICQARYLEWVRLSVASVNVVNFSHKTRQRFLLRIYIRVCNITTEKPDIEIARSSKVF